MRSLTPGTAINIPIRIAAVSLVLEERFVFHQ